MKLTLLHEAEILPITEGYGRTNEFDYTHFNVDPKPKVLKLGTWIHPNTRNVLVAGINLNYLNDNQIKKLRYYLPEILKDRNLRRRYWTGRRLLPDVFGEPPGKGAYRTYRLDRIQAISPGTLRTMTPKELRDIGDTERADRLDQRRTELKKKPKAPSGISPREKPPTELEPEAELEFPEPEQEPEQEPSIEGPADQPDTTAEKAKDEVDQKRVEKEIADLGDEERADLASGAEPGPEEEPEEPEEMDLEPEQPEELEEPEGEEEEPR